jgi:hypothetical protein
LFSQGEIAMLRQLSLLSAIFALGTTILFFPASTVLSRDMRGQVLLRGDLTCGKFIESLNKPSQRIQIKANIVGYTDAYNTWVNDTCDILGDTDLDSVLLWLENFCRERPLNNVATGLHQLMLELHETRRISCPEGQEKSNQ